MYQQEQATPRIFPVEIKFDTVEPKYRLPDVVLLRGKTILGVFYSPLDSSGNGCSITGRDLMSNDLIPCCFLKIQQDSDNFIDEAPLTYFTITDEWKAYHPLGKNGMGVQGIDTTKSEVVFPDPSNRPTAGESMVLYFIAKD